MQTELKYTARFPESLYEPRIWDSEEASVQIFSLDSYWDYSRALSAEHRSKFAALHRQLWRLHINEKFLCESKTLHKKPIWINIRFSTFPHPTISFLHVRLLLMIFYSYIIVAFKKKLSIVTQFYNSFHSDRLNCHSPYNQNILWLNV